MPPTYRNIVEEFRQRILSRDNDAVIAVLQAYSNTAVNIKESLDKLVAKIEELKAAGQVVRESDIYLQVRYQEFIQQLRREIKAYHALVSEVVSEAQKDAIKIALDQADATLNFIFKEAPSNFFETFLRFDEVAASNIVARLSDDGYLERLMNVSEASALQKVRDILISGVIRGEPPKLVASQLMTSFDLLPQQAETIARTEVLSAYRDANIIRYSNSKTVKAWEWSATLDERTCPVCVYMDGQQFSLETPFATHPSCRCSPIPITFTFEELGLDIPEPKPPDMGPRGENWFKFLSREKQEKILGKKKFELYESGQIDLKDLTQYYIHGIYGPSRQERSIKKMKELRIIS